MFILTKYVVSSFSLRRVISSLSVVEASNGPCMIHSVRIMCTLKLPSIQDIPISPDRKLIHPMICFYQSLKEKELIVWQFKVMSQQWNSLTSEKKEPHYVKAEEHRAKNQQFINNLAEYQKERLEEYKLQRRAFKYEKEIKKDKIHLYDDSSNQVLKARRLSSTAMFIHHRHAQCKKEGKRINVTDIWYEWKQMNLEEKELFVAMMKQSSYNKPRTITRLDIYDAHIKKWRRICEVILSRKNPFIMENAETLSEYKKELDTYKENLSELMKRNENEYKLHKKAQRLEKLWTNAKNSFWNLLDQSYMQTNESKLQNSHQKSSKSNLLLFRYKNLLNKLIAVYNELLALRNCSEELPKENVIAYDCFVQEQIFRQSGSSDKKISQEDLKNSWMEISEAERKRYSSKRLHEIVKKLKLLETYRIILMESLQNDVKNVK